jgi:peptidoglycan DL-endopeptidase CwlO
MRYTDLFSCTSAFVLTAALASPLFVPAAPAGAAAAQRASFGERSMAVAARYEGVPYRAGGTTPRGFDCSGYTRFVYAKLDKRIPRSSQQQYRAAERVHRPRVGDLIFYHSGGRGSVYHVAIYAGRGKVWHSTRPGEDVRKTKIHSRTWTAGRY